LAPPAVDLAKSTEDTTGEGFALGLFDKQKTHFADGVTKIESGESIGSID
jgi:hypothetical protein